jgi:hypothetical protein
VQCVGNARLRITVVRRTRIGVVDDWRCPKQAKPTKTGFSAVTCVSVRAGRSCWRHHIRDAEHWIALLRNAGSTIRKSQRRTGEASSRSIADLIAVAHGVISARSTRCHRGMRNTSAWIAAIYGARVAVVYRQRTADTHPNRITASAAITGIAICASSASRCERVRYSSAWIACVDSAGIVVAQRRRCSRNAGSRGVAGRGPVTDVPIRASSSCCGRRVGNPRAWVAGVNGARIVVVDHRWCAAHATSTAIARSATSVAQIASRT